MCAPICRGGIKISMQVAEPKQETIHFTGRHKVALMLERAGYDQKEIGRRLGINHQPNVSRLLKEAHAAEKAFREAAIDFLMPD